MRGDRENQIPRIFLQNGGGACPPKSAGYGQPVLASAASLTRKKFSAEICLLTSPIHVVFLGRSLLSLLNQAAASN
jgi:hypothetical protein